MHNYHDKDDSTLVQMTLLGDESAFAELVLRHQRAVMGTTLKVTGNRFSAEDASQDAFVSAWINLSALRNEEKFGIWVCSIAKNHARTLEAHYRSAIPSISLNEFENLDIPDAQDPDIFEYADLHDKIGALSEKIREVIKLHYFSDLSIKDIAKKLSLPEGTVKWRLSEGRKQLRKGYGIMEKAYDEIETVADRVMRQVEALKLWKLKEDKSGFEAEYQAVLELVNELPDSKKKSHALADTWLLGAWWIPGQKNDEIYEKIKKAAEDGHNDEVMQSVAYHEQQKYSGEEKRNFMLNTQIPYFKEKGFRISLGYTWFWLGFEYRKAEQYKKAIEAFRETMKVLPPENEYYANAKSAIYCETKVIKEKQKNNLKISTSFNVTGEKYRFINGKLYFWGQPGYGQNFLEEINTASLFFNLSLCDHLMIDPEMKVGDVITSGLGNGKLTFVSNAEVCNTPAGIFENCLVYEFKGHVHGFTYCKTFICDGVGIVYQEVERYNLRCAWQLSKFNIVGGRGIIPFATGNRWDYDIAPINKAVKYDTELFFEVTAAKNNEVTLASVAWRGISGYYDTFDGKIAEITQTYGAINGNVCTLIDVGDKLRRAKELAVTKRQKVRVNVVEDVLTRIFDTDKEFNPNYKEKGLWNFYSSYAMLKNDGTVTWTGNEHFEWKDIPIMDSECNKMIYSFFDSIVDTCGLGLWSDKWIPGFTAKPVHPVKASLRPQPGHPAKTSLYLRPDHPTTASLRPQPRHRHSPRTGITRPRTRRTFRPLWPFSPQDVPPCARPGPSSSPDRARRARSAHSGPDTPSGRPAGPPGCCWLP